MTAKKINCGLAVMYVCVYVQYLLQLYEQLNGLQKSIFQTNLTQQVYFNSCIYYGRFIYFFLKYKNADN